jgi:hypothetical protein
MASGVSIVAPACGSQLIGPGGYVRKGTCLILSARSEGAPIGEGWFTAHGHTSGIPRSTWHTLSN